MNETTDDLLIRIIEIAMHVRPDESGRVRLPTERELSEVLDVQRPTVRERLTVLETLGFVTRRQGSGTFLSLPNAQVLQFYFEVSLKLGFLSLEQIQKALEMIGMEMAVTASIDASREEFDALDAVVARMADAPGIDGFAQCQLDFHIELARAAHNPVIILIIDGLTSVIRAVMTNRVRMISVVKGSFDRSVATHRSVVQALRDREPEMARIALQECFSLWRRESSKISMLYVTE
ncbi:FCD domain-containing protein [Rhodoferax sp.]|uniref:FadR/GntR family transcriptional regulator n=1 Tax=Rhodoferax sp. TaxID=50421 RepID=UPI0025FB5584|nr:FCD domain-containing protein [Rhodoferax sp.]MCM2297056.1 FCD domain-containing protein [Rhodoferax sp.]